jgi:hypothetical protein
MAMRGKVRMNRQVSEASNRLQIGGSSVFCWTSHAASAVTASQNTLEALSEGRAASLIAL